MREGLTRLAEVEERTRALDVRPDIAGYSDLAHAFDLRGSLLAARATLDCALERRETRGAHNRSDFPDLDPGLQVNFDVDARRDAPARSPWPLLRLSVSSPLQDADLGSPDRLPE